MIYGIKISTIECRGFVFVFFNGIPHAVVEKMPKWMREKKLTVPQEKCEEPEYSEKPN